MTSTFKSPSRRIECVKSVHRHPGAGKRRKFRQILPPEFPSPSIIPLIIPRLPSAGEFLKYPGNSYSAGWLAVAPLRQGGSQSHVHARLNHQRVHVCACVASPCWLASHKVWTAWVVSCQGCLIFHAGGSTWGTWYRLQPNQPSLLHTAVSRT